MKIFNKSKYFIYKQTYSFCIENGKKDFAKFDKDNEEISVKDKYKDFSLNHLKLHTQKVKREEKFFIDKIGEYSKLGPFELRKIGRSLYNRNFLNKKVPTEQDKIEKEGLEKAKLDITKLKDINLAEPIILYEIHTELLTAIMSIQRMALLYFISNIPMTLLMLGSYKILLTKTAFAYTAVYISNLIASVSVLLNYKLKKSTVVEIIYLYQEESIVIKTFGGLFGLKINEYKYRIDELEYIKSGRYLETEYVLRVKRDHRRVYCLEELTWYHRDILENLYKFI
jgi:hypothetical protein